MYLDVRCPKALNRARTLTRGVYQDALLSGHEAWSGATLRGRAKEYGARYKSSRENLIDRLRAHGIDCRFERRKHGKIVLVIAGLSDPA